MKLPEKICEPKHCKTLAEYAQGWNMTINCVECWCNRHGDEEAKEMLLEAKESYEKAIVPYYKGAYDCSVEIERLNAEPKHRLDNFFKDSLDALDKLKIRSEVSPHSKGEEKTKVIVDKERLIKLLNYLSKDCPFELMKDEEPIFTCSLDNCLSDEPYCWKEWLKVKELPQKKIKEYDDDIYEIDYKWGFNDCLDEILGEK